MRILQVIQKRQLRGAEIFACQLSQELAHRGIHVDIVYLFPSDTVALDYNLSFIGLDANPNRRFWDIKGYRRLAQIIKKGKYDIVQANAGDTLKYTVLSKVFFGWRTQLIFRNANLMSGFIRSKLHRAFNKWLLEKCDFFISVSENSRQDLITLFPRAASLSETISIGTFKFDNIQPINRNIPAEEPIFVSISSFVPEKNHIFLIEVFNLYYQQKGRGVLWLVGDGKERANLERKVDQFGIKDRVHFWGYRNDVISILKSADVFIMTSQIEGLPGVILEAMSCEVPVVTSAIGGIPEIVENDVTGICIKEWLPELYVSSIFKLLNDKDYKSRLVRNGKMTFLKKFTMEKVTSDFLIRYQDLIQVKRK